MVYAKIIDTEVRQWINYSLAEIPKEIRRAVTLSALKGVRYARKLTPRITGQARKSWQNKILKDKGAKEQYGLRRRIASYDVAVYVINGGRKAGMTKPYKRMGKTQQPKKIAPHQGNNYVKNDVLPFVQSELEKNIDALINKVVNK